MVSSSNYNDYVWSPHDIPSFSNSSSSLTIVNEWNDKTAEITGFGKEEALNKPLVSTFIVPSLRQVSKNLR